MAPRRHSNAPIPTLLLVVDRSLSISTFVAPESVGGIFEDAVGSGDALHLLPWSDSKKVATTLKAALQGRRQHFSGWQLGTHQFDGSVLPLRNVGKAVSGAIVVGTDAAELLDLRHALRQSQEMTSSAYFVLDMASMTVNVTPAFAQIWGFDPNFTKIPFDAILERVHEEDREAFSRQQDAVALYPDLRLDYRIEHPHNGTRHLRTHGSFLRDKAGEIRRTVGTVVDITEHVLAKHTAAFLASHDPLTGLLNRKVFIDLLKDSTANSEDRASLIIIDIDRFAQINDVAGHAIGDRLLCAVAERLQFLEKLGHSVARLGADEFACLLIESKGSATADRIVESLRQRLDVPFSIDENQYFIHTTIGVAEYPKDGSGDLLLQNAGIALLSAKSSARGSVAKYHSDLERKLSARSRIERDLTRAIEREQFEMFYQPVINAATGQMIGAEALLRWKHPDLGLLTPDSFLNVAEESDAVVSIGRWTIERACRDAIELRGRLGKEMRLNVNVSPRHVQSSALVDDVTSALSSSGWSASQLQLEVTEQLLIADIPSAASTLRQLRGHGVTVAIDDFGTGYNTLSYLKSYPVSCIKIDRAFVRDAESDDYSRAICRSVTALAESLDMNLIGEGVETPGQAAFLKNIGCRELQGYHFGRPVAVSDFISAYAS